jgi:hypothetical protein
MRSVKTNNDYDSILLILLMTCIFIARSAVRSCLELQCLTALLVQYDNDQQQLASVRCK